MSTENEKIQHVFQAIPYPTMLVLGLLSDEVQLYCFENDTNKYVKINALSKLQIDKIIFTHALLHQEVDISDYDSDTFNAHFEVFQFLHAIGIQDEVIISHVLIDDDLMSKFFRLKEQFQQLDLLDKIQMELKQDQDKADTKKKCHALLDELLTYNRITQNIRDQHPHHYATPDHLAYYDTFINTDDFKISANKHGDRLEKSASFAEQTMDWVYVGLNFLTIALGVATLAHGNTSIINGISTNSGISWNGIDGIGGFAVAINQLHNGQTVRGVSNLFSATQLLAFTTSSVIISNIHIATLGASAAATMSAAFMGFSFALCMGVAAGIEMYGSYKCSQRIKELQNELKPLKGTSEHEKQEVITVKKAILLERAKKMDHRRNAKVWTACAMAMTAVAILGVVAVSGLTFGTATVPAVAVATAAVAFSTGVARTAYFRFKKSSVDKLKQASKGQLVDRFLNLEEKYSENEEFNTISAKLEKLLYTDVKKAKAIIDLIDVSPGNEGFFEKLRDLEKENANFDSKVSLGMGLFKAQVSMKDYILDMLIKDPEKARNIVNAYNKPEELVRILGQRRRIGIFEARGMSLYNKLNALPSVEAPPPVTPPLTPAN